MTESPQQLLGYSSQPSSSLANCEVGADGAVRVTLPPILRRRIAQIALGAAAIALVGAVMCFRLTRVYDTPFMFFAALFLGGPSLGVIAVTLWMGFRWTIIEVDATELRLELRGLLSNRRKVWPRNRITGLRKRVSLQILGPRGSVIGRIDATDPKEERWVMQVLQNALALPAST